MPRTTILIAAMLVAFLVSACGTSTPAPPDATDTPTDAPQATASPAPEGEGDGAPQPGTDLDACEIVTPADVAVALSIEEAEVAAGELSESPTSLSPGHTECDYEGEWGGLRVSLTPEDGANLFDAARGSYADATDVEIAGANGAFWSADAKRGFFWKGSVNVLLQFSHLTTGADFAEATAAIGQAAMDRVE